MSSQSYTTDTSRDAEQVQLELIRKVPPTQRLEKSLRLSSDLLRASKAAIRRRYPSFSEHDVSIKFIELHYGVDLAEGVRNQLENRP